MKSVWKGKNLHSYFCAFHLGGRERKIHSEKKKAGGEKERNEKERATVSEKTQ